MLKNIKIGKLLISTFVAVAILASISGIVSMVLITRIDSQYSYALTSYGFSQGDIGKAMSAMQRTRCAIRDIIGFTNQENIDIAKKEMEATSATTLGYLENVKKTLTAPEELALYQVVEDTLPIYMAKRDELLALGDTTDAQQSALAQERLIAELDPIFMTMYNSLVTLMDRNVDTGNKLSTELTALGRSSLVLNITLILVSLVVSTGIALAISKGITKPLKEIETASSLLAEGNLNATLTYTSKNELGVVAEKTRALIENLKAIIGDIQRGLSEVANGNFDIMLAVEYVGDFEALKESILTIIVSLSDTLRQINQSSDQVSSGSDQVSSGAQALSQGATEQASSVEELAATIAEIANQINQTAGNAAQANDKTNSVGAEANESNRRMQDMLNAMSHISNSSNEIGKIIKTIEDIAFQTNILALNAAVEAARAGAAGKGFAVVADEVRNLASKSAEASKNTAALIEDSLKAVSNGTKIADETAQSLNLVVTGVEEVADTIGKITEASKSQASSIAQVTTGIDQISSVVQTNSATAEESAAASEELSGQASMLKELVSKFKLLNTDLMKNKM